MPCFHDGTCMDGINTYTCECVAGYDGDQCETGTFFHLWCAKMVIP